MCVHRKIEKLPQLKVDVLDELNVIDLLIDVFPHNLSLFHSERVHVARDHGGDGESCTKCQQDGIAIGISA